MGADAMNVQPPTDLEPVRTETHAETLARQNKPEALVRISAEDAQETLRKFHSGELQKERKR